MKYLLEYLKTYELWLENGAPDGVVFSRRHGLCLNIDGYAEQFFPDDDTVEDVLLEELLKALKQDQINPVLPFIQWAWYADESRNKTCHLNQGRNEWIRKTIVRMTSTCSPS